MVHNLRGAITIKTIKRFVLFYRKYMTGQGGADEIPLSFTLHKQSRPTCISHKERLEGPEVLSFVERVSMVHYHSSYLV